ncbi:MAG: SAM-dependent methyltransferase [Deltaproteobacteria bacterium]|nr:SAM-dependent methyltransferase [Deltaproteobacteria bacterium]MDL1961422.1 SAM-dependent methyltransferase [Deltaproteobacteria bacterium]
MKDFSNELIKIIHDKVKEFGPITFKDFMEMALYHEKYGYYSRSYIPIGKKGDFITSPHTHCLYGALHARQIEEFWNILDHKAFTVVEMGSGAGYLAKDILSYLSNREIFKSINYIIVEHKAETASCQQDLLKPFINKINWISRLSDLDSIKGCVISNELLDAFPVHLIQKEALDFKEIYLDFNEEDNLTEVLGNLSNPQLAEYVKALPSDLSEGYRTEANLAIRKWISELASIISKGFVVTIDYGHTRKEYFHPARNRGTLLAYMNHRVNEELYERPGEQDLTAHVNFSDLHRWGKEVGFSTLGYVPQWAFLGGLDFEETFRELSGGKFDPFSPELAAVKMLLLPQGMGESHKVLVQGKDVPSDLVLKGFSLKNAMKRL